MLAGAVFTSAGDIAASSTAATELIEPSNGTITQFVASLLPHLPRVNALDDGA